MKFKSGLFLIGLTAVIGQVGNAYATKCEAGKYLWRYNQECRDCPSGCYCGGDSSTDRFPVDPKATISDSTLELWCSHQTETCTYSSGDAANGGKQCGDSNRAKVFRCPEDFLGSLAGSQDIKSCYRYFGEKKVTYGTTKCGPGKYLPKRSNASEPCKEGYYCPGGTFWASADKDQGLEICPSGQKPNSTQTACECPSGFVPTGDGTNCEITIDAGYFVSTNTNKKSLCSNNNKVDSKHYCPGGTFKMEESANLGIVECPYGGTSDGLRTGCRLELTVDQMKFGVSGAKSGKEDTKCWWYTDLTEFKDCVFGTKSSRKGELIYTRGSGTPVDASKMTISEADFTGATATFAPSPRQ